MGRLAVGDTRAHTGHSDDDTCPVCGAPWTGWPMSHKGDDVCSQLCERKRDGMAEAARVNVEPARTKKKKGRKRG